MLPTLNLIKRKVAKYDYLRNFLNALRLQKFITAFTGPVYERSRDLIEIDINYACHLKCFNCNRACGLAPSPDRVSLEQIRKFIEESTAKGLQWQRIRILGGEPTLHPEFLQIVEALLAFRKSQHPEATIEVVTNGLGQEVNDILARLSAEVVVDNTAKKSRVQNFRPFSLAPKDFVRFKYADFSSGCWIISTCGFGLSPYGYYPCAVGATVDRVFGFDIGRKSIPSPSDPMLDQLKVLCPYCGHFMTNRQLRLDRDLMSEFWRRAYAAYQVSKPRLTLY